MIRSCQEEVQNLEEPRLGLTQATERLQFVRKEGGGLARVGERVVDALFDQLVVLHQTVVRILGKAERRQNERINDRQAQEGQAGGALAQERKVMLDEVMAKHAIGSLSEVIQLPEKLLPRGVPRPR